MDSKSIAAQIADQDSKRVTSTDAFNEAMGQFGVPEIRKNVATWRTTIANTKNSLNAVDPSVTGRTSQSLVTEAQRAKIVNNERAPIAGQLGEQQDAYSLANSDLNEATAQATTQAGNKVRDWETGRANLQNMYDTTYKREQDSMAAQIAAEQEQRRRAESDRAYGLDVAAASRAGAAGKAKAPSKNDVAPHIVSNFNSLRGRDGKVSNETWQNGLNDWTAAGGSVRDFWKMYGDYVNTKYTTSYAGYKNR